MILSEKNVCSYWGLRDWGWRPFGGGIEAPALCGRPGSHRCFLNRSVKNAMGCFEHSPKNGPQEEKLKS